VQPHLPERLSRTRAALGTWLLVGMLPFAAAHGVGLGMPAWVAGVLAWAAGAVLWPRLDHRQRRQCYLLFGVGVLALLWAAARGVPEAWPGVLTQNTALLAMLVGVSFLQLIGPQQPDESLPRGRAALWRTLFGVHLLGAVINLSAVFIMADRMAAGQRPAPLQAAVLVRAFLAAALWSPFFAAVAIAVTYAPGATLGSVVVCGLPMALALLLLAGQDLLAQARDGVADFVGYPMHLSALQVPLLLAAAVAAVHELRPEWSALTTITLVAPLVAILTVLWRAGPAEAMARVARHAATRLPTMSGELLLFLSAAVFATGLQALMKSGGVWQPFNHFGPAESAATLTAMIGLAMLGIHPVISIATASAWLLPLAPDPVLLALVFCQSWAIGLAVGPMSGIHLALQGRYGLSATAMARGNMRYGLKAYLLAVLWQLAVGWWRGLV
jgi:hypothetical protein